MRGIGQDAPGGALTWESARSSPCADCGGAPCCQWLPLLQFPVQNLRDLDQAAYLLNFERLALGITAAGQWGAYYRRSCRFLDAERAACTLHGTPQQPRICVNYNPFTCWYKRALGDATSDDFVPIDRGRLQRVLAMVALDSGRNLVTVPDWDTLRAAVADVPLEPVAAAEPVVDEAALAEWARLVADGTSGATATAPLGFDEAFDPCDGCAAPCCTTLLFPHNAPANRGNLDYFKFCLGFPGVELGVSERGWNVVVRTRCRHLEGARCALHDRPERPLVCRYYDAWGCHYKPEFGEARPADFLRVRLEHFQWLAECFPFDQAGNVLKVPTTTQVRAHLETRWRAALRTPAASPPASPSESSPAPSPGPNPAPTTVSD